MNTFFFPFANIQIAISDPDGIGYTMLRTELRKFLESNTATDIMKIIKPPVDEDKNEHQKWIPLVEGVKIPICQDILILFTSDLHEEPTHEIGQYDPYRMFPFNSEDFLPGELESIKVTHFAYMPK
jgi:hypothetical protein